MVTVAPLTKPVPCRSVMAVPPPETPLLGVMADQIFTERRNRRQVALMRELSAREAKS